MAEETENTAREIKPFVKMGRDDNPFNAVDFRPQRTATATLEKEPEAVEETEDAGDKEADPNVKPDDREPETPAEDPVEGAPPVVTEPPTEDETTPEPTPTEPPSEDEPPTEPPSEEPPSDDDEPKSGSRSKKRGN